jgi:MYXO-CTERM domain-containing protein
MSPTASLLTLLFLLAPPALPIAAAAVPAASRRVEPPTDATEPTDLAANAMPIVRAPRPDSEPPIATDTRPLQLGSKILFVNFDGGELNSCGNNDPINNCTTIFGGTVLPYTGDAGNRAAVIQVARKRVEDFGITVTDVRPGSGDYDMEMVGNWQGSSPDFAGIAPAGDCWDNYGGETSFTLEISTSADAIAEVMMQELAHTWGLDHVDEQQDLLYPTTQGTNKTYRDECHQVVADTDLNPTSGDCSHHQDACGSYSQQNSHAELLLIFGPSVADTAAPAIQILAPADGATVDGGDFDLQIGLQDDQLPAVINTTITIESDALVTPIPPSDGAFASPAELTFPIKDLPNGIYTIRIDGEDESDNPASDEITITIEGSDVPPPSDDGAADSGEAGSGEAGTAVADDSEGDSDDEGGSDDQGGGTGGGDGGQTGGERGDDPKGCACASDERGRSALAGMPLLVLLVLRRRRGSKAVLA